MQIYLRKPAKNTTVAKIQQNFGACQLLYHVNFYLWLLLCDKVQINLC